MIMDSRDGVEGAEADDLPLGASFPLGCIGVFFPYSVVCRLLFAS